MKKYFLAVVGTGNYRETDYYYENNDKCVFRTRFSQEAILHMLKEKGEEITHIRYFMTDEAQKNNWEKFEREVNGVKTEDRGLREITKGIFPEAQVEIVRIPVGKDEKQLLEIYMSMYHAVEPESELFFDVTHGFRTIPMLFFPLIHYLETLKKTNFMGVYYGAIEAEGQIFDLSLYKEIMDWSFAAKAFSEYGINGPLDQLASGRRRQMEIKKDSSFRKAGSCIRLLTKVAQGIQTGRGKRGKNSIEESYGIFRQEYERYLSEEEQNEAEGFSLIQPLLKYVDDSLKGFDVDNNMTDLGMACIRWNVDKNMIQQGYTALEETMKTFVCELFGIDSTSKENLRERVVNSAINYGISILREKVSDKESFLDYQIRFPENIEKNETWEMDKEYAEMTKYLIKYIPYEIIQLANKIKVKRNDLNHFGMNNSPAKAEDIISGFKDHADEFEVLVGRLREDFSPSDIIINFTNHPSEYWGEEQRNAANEYGRIVDLQFPCVSPLATAEEIENLAFQYYCDIVEKRPRAVLCMGEFSLCYHVVNLLKKHHYTVLHTCSERNVDEMVTENGNTQKSVLYEFVSFREY